jgi:hypothetical protein
MMLRDALSIGSMKPTPLYKDACSLPFVKKVIDRMPTDYALMLGYCKVNDVRRMWVSKMMFTLWTGNEADDPRASIDI